MARVELEELIFLGDSLSERAQMASRKLLDCIPMRGISGLNDAGAGRFTDELVWTDYVGTALANELNIPDLTEDIEHRGGTSLTDEDKVQRAADSADIADEVTTKKHDQAEMSYRLDNSKVFIYKGLRLASSWAEGGLSASDDYAWKFTSSISLFFKRIILSTLSEKRKLLLADDAVREVSPEQKRSKVIIELSGGNDLLTQNASPTNEIADKAVDARMQNVEELIKNGYQHFVLFNLPDLSLTPRIQALSAAEQQQASLCVDHFNAELVRRCEILRQTYPHCQIDVFDLNSKFKEMYNNPEKYGFDKNLLKQYLTEAPKQDNPDGTQTVINAKEYMFWNEIHPSSKAHGHIGLFFLEWFRKKYKIVEPQVHAQQEKEINISEAELLGAFRRLYAASLQRASQGIIGFFRRHFEQPSNFNYKTATLQEIITNALFEDGSRSLSVLKQLQWFNENGHLNLNIPVLKAAYQAALVVQTTKGNIDEFEGPDNDPNMDEAMKYNLKARR